MCRLFGFRSNVPSRAHKSLVEAENAVAEQAVDHADGWGIGYYKGRDAYVVKAGSGAADDARFSRITETLTSHAFLVHVRNATVGQTDTFNCHPFRHGNWLFAHNGTVFGFDTLEAAMIDAMEPGLAELLFGTTDSEPLFFYILSHLVRAGLPADGRAEVDVDVAAGAIRAALFSLFDLAQAAGQYPPIANFILTNGSVMFAQQAGLSLFMATQKLSCADYATCPIEDKVCMRHLPPLHHQTGSARRWGRQRRVNHLLVASEPIGTEDVWETIPDGAMVALDASLQLHLYPPPSNFRLCPSPPAPRRIQLEDAPTPGGERTSHC